jgi:hypothetical protein
LRHHHDASSAHVSASAMAVIARSAPAVAVSMRHLLSFRSLIPLWPPSRAIRPPLAKIEKDADSGRTESGQGAHHVAAVLRKFEISFPKLRFPEGTQQLVSVLHCTPPHAICKASCIWKTACMCYLMGFSTSAYVGAHTQPVMARKAGTVITAPCLLAKLSSVVAG